MKTKIVSFIFCAARRVSSLSFGQARRVQSGPWIKKSFVTTIVWEISICQILAFPLFGMEPSRVYIVTHDIIRQSNYTTQTHESENTIFNFCFNIISSSGRCQFENGERKQECMWKHLFKFVVAFA